MAVTFNASKNHPDRASRLSGNGGARSGVGPRPPKNGYQLLRRPAGPQQPRACCGLVLYVVNFAVHDLVKISAKSPITFTRLGRSKSKKPPKNQKSRFFVFWAGGSTRRPKIMKKFRAVPNRAIRVVAKFRLDRTRSFAGNRGQSPAFRAPWRSRDCHVTEIFFFKRSLSFLATITSERLSIGAVQDLEIRVFEFSSMLNSRIFFFG
jgi:hypothetical protein